MKRVILSILLLLLFINMVSPSQQTLGTFEQGKCIDLIQVCGDCTYNNLSSITYPNATRIILDVEMEKRLAEYNYTYCFPNSTGTYSINGVGDLNHIDSAWAYDLTLTVNGRSEPSDNVVLLFVILFLIILGTLLSLILYNILHLIQWDFDGKDLTYNITAYFLLFAIYILSLYYLGNEFINGVLLLIIVTGAFTNVILPIIAFVMSYIKGGLDGVNYE